MALSDGAYTLVAENAAQDNNSNLIDLEYEVKLVKRFSQPATQDYSSLPSIKPENNAQFNLSGKKQRFTMEFLLYDDGTDRSNGTLSNSQISDNRFSGGTVETVLEQKVWLTEFINTFQFSTSFRLFGRDYTGRTEEGGTPFVFTETRPEPRPGETQNRMTFIVQGNIGNRVI